MSIITGLHHVTVISGDAQENLDFYVRVLGMRLVKRSVNQDDPGTYHLFYADGAGHPGTDLTFFPWARMPRGRPGVGLTSEVALAVPAGSLDWWSDRLTRLGTAIGERTVRFGEPTLTLADPHGVSLALVETSDPSPGSGQAMRDFTPWADSPVPEAYQIRGLHGVRFEESTLLPTESFLTRTFGFEKLGEEQGWHRYGVLGGGSGRVVDVRSNPGAQRGTWGVGSVHHVAFRVPDDEAELIAQRAVGDAGRQPTPVIDRFWFKSVYFKEPGGVLFEIATDGPGFAVDEDPSALGEQLVLPPFLEEHRAEIERRLPPLTMPTLEPAR